MSRQERPMEFMVLLLEDKQTENNQYGRPLGLSFA